MSKMHSRKVIRATNVQFAAERKKMETIWNSDSVQSVREITNIVRIICLPTSMWSREFLEEENGKGIVVCG